MAWWDRPSLREYHWTVTKKRPRGGGLPAAPAAPASSAAASNTQPGSVMDAVLGTLNREYREKGPARRSPVAASKTAHAELTACSRNPPPAHSARSGGSVSLPLTTPLSEQLRPSTSARRAAAGKVAGAGAAPAAGVGAGFAAGLARPSGRRWPRGRANAPPSPRRTSRPATGARAAKERPPPGSEGRPASAPTSSPSSSSPSSSRSRASASSGSPSGGAVGSNSATCAGSRGGSSRDDGVRAAGTTSAAPLLPPASHLVRRHVQDAVEPAHGRARPQAAAGAHVARDARADAPRGDAGDGRRMAVPQKGRARGRAGAAGGQVEGVARRDGHLLGRGRGGQQEQGHLQRRAMRHHGGGGGCRGAAQWRARPAPAGGTAAKWRPPRPPRRPSLPRTRLPAGW